MQTDLYMLQTYGPWFLILILILKDLLPFLREKLFPDLMKERNEESERRWALSERQVQAYEAIAKAMQQTTVFLATLDARSEVTANGVQRLEIITTEINTRSRAQEQKTTPIARRTTRKTMVRNEPSGL